MCGGGREVDVVDVGVPGHAHVRHDGLRVVAIFVGHSAARKEKLGRRPGAGRGRRDVADKPRVVFDPELRRGAVVLDGLARLGIHVRRRAVVVLPQVDQDGVGLEVSQLVCPVHPRPEGGAGPMVLQSSTPAHFLGMQFVGAGAKICVA